MHERVGTNPMNLARIISCLAALAVAAATVSAAINPAEFQRPASEVLRLREVARVVHDTKDGGRHLQRITLVATVVEVRETRGPREGDTVVIDYTIDVSARDAASKQHEKESGRMPGPQFMGEPDAPTLDEKKEFWAHLAPLGGRLGNVNRHAGRVVGIGDYTKTDNVFVPVAGQYSFVAPMGR